MTIPVTFISALIGDNRYTSPAEKIKQLMEKNCEFANEIYKVADNGTIFLPEAVMYDVNTRCFIDVMRKTAPFERFVSADQPTVEDRESVRRLAKEYSTKFDVETVDGVAVENFGFVERGRQREKNTIEMINECLFEGRQIVEAMKREYCSEYKFVHLADKDGTEEVCVPAKYRVRGKPDGITEDDGVIEVKNRMYKFIHLSHEIEQVIAYVALGGHAYGTLVQYYNGQLRFSRRYARAECEQKWASIRRKLETVLSKIFACLYSRDKAREFINTYLRGCTVPIEITSPDIPIDGCQIFDGEESEAHDASAASRATIQNSIFRDVIDSPV